jgi:DNA-binding transcriptional LysR family regulator
MMVANCRSGEPAHMGLTRGAQSWQGSPPSRARANSPETLLHLARQGLGITMIGDHFAQMCKFIGVKRLPIEEAIARGGRWLKVQEIENGMDGN